MKTKILYCENILVEKYIEGIGFIDKTILDCSTKRDGNKNIVVHVQVESAPSFIKKKYTPYDEYRIPNI